MASPYGIGATGLYRIMRVEKKRYICVWMGRGGPTKRGLFPSIPLRVTLTVSVVRKNIIITYYNRNIAMAVSESLIASARERAQKWLSEDYDEETRRQVQRLLDAEDPAELVDAFYRDLEFGTGGMRGIMGAGTNRMNKYNIGAATQGLSNYMIKEFGEDADLKVVVGYDGRHNSTTFARIVADVFTANGIRVYLFKSLRPTPMISYAIRHFGCQSGGMVTASHNPREYNGFKVYWEDGAQIIAPHDKNIIGEVNKIRSVRDIKFEGREDLITVIDESFDEQYIDALLTTRLTPEAIKAHHDLCIVYTPLHGTGSQINVRAMEAAGFDNIHPVTEQMVVDGDFPTVDSPNPENPEAMKMALDLAHQVDADLVLASDPDADRLAVGCKDNEGKYVLLTGNQTCLLYAYYAIKRHQEIGDLSESDYLVKTIVTTDLIRNVADAGHVELYDCYTGFKWIASVMRQNEGTRRYLGGGEESIGYLWEDFVRDKDSVSACIIMGEIFAWALEQGMTLYQLLDKIYLEYGYSIEKTISVVRPGVTGAQEIEDMMKNFRHHPLQELAGEQVTEVLDYSTLEGRDQVSGETYTLDFPTTSNVLQFFTASGTKLSIRPSGTEPKIKFYIEVHASPKDSDQLTEARRTCDERVEAIRKQLDI